MSHIDKNKVKTLRFYAIIFLGCIIMSLISCSSDATDTNRFYRRHIDQFVSCNRSFTVINGSEILEKPDGKTLTETKAGDVLMVDSYYTDSDGEVWGYITKPVEGFLKMSEIKLVFDNVAFNEVKSDEITDAGSYSLPEGPRYLWSYPCSGVIVGTDYSSEEEINISTQYIDEKERIWVYFDSAGWICLDAPYDSSIEKVYYGDAEMTYFIPEKDPGYWDTAPDYAPYVWSGITLIIIVEVVAQIRAHKKRHKR